MSPSKKSGESPAKEDYHGAYGHPSPVTAPRGGGHGAPEQESQPARDDDDDEDEDDE